ncbi:hypothetical protein L7F22_047276 [Adiantum nelumboides]|nr:hypothetical protein [Adiantum nelumboides]
MGEVEMIDEKLLFGGSDGSCDLRVRVQWSTIIFLTSEGGLGIIDAELQLMHSYQTSCSRAEESSLEVVEEPPSPHEQDASSMVAGPDFSCGISSTLLPDYPWGTTHFLSKGKLSGQTDIAIEAGSSMQDVEQERQDIDRSSHDENICSCGLASAIIPAYPWGVCRKHSRELENAGAFSQSVEPPPINESTCTCGIAQALFPEYQWGYLRNPKEQQGRLQPDHDQDAVDRDRTCGLGFTMLPEFPWGQSLSTAKSKPDPIISSQEVKNYIEQETKIEARITSKTDVFTVTTTKMTYPGEKPPQSITAMIPQETSQTVQHVKLDQMVSVIDASVKIDQAGGTKQPPLASLPSTGFALLDLEKVDLGGKERIETQPSTGYARLDKLIEEQKLPTSEIEEDPASVKYTYSETKSDSNWQSSLQGSYDKQEKIRPQTPPSGTQFPSFEWSVGKLDAGELTTPLLNASIEPETETFVSVLKPAPVGFDQPKGDNWLSVFKVSKPADDGGLTAPLLTPASAYTEEIEEVKRPVSRPQSQVAAEAVIDVPPSDSGRPSVGAIPATVPGLATTRKETDEWDILKSIVYGGLDISIASIGVTSSAAGGNAITRTVVYMGLATLLSGLIGFYHNVLNLYHHHRDHYINVVGVTLMLHGTVALISFVVFGLLSPLVYLFSYRETDDRDDKFITCCVVTIVAVTALALGKAKVSNKRYLTTLFAYLGGGVLAAIIGYLAGEHVAELLEEWGF